MFAKESHIAVKTSFLIILSLCLMAVDAHTGLRQCLRDFFSIPITAIQYFVSWPVQTIQQSGVFFKTHRNLIKDNKKLLFDQLMLTANVQRLMAVESENDQLRALLNASSHVQGKVLAAQLLSIDSDPYVRQLTLNRGQRDGLFVGQTVLDAYGVLGQIIEVNPRTSRVLLIDDPVSGVPVQTVRNGVRAIAVGDTSSNGLRLANVPQTADVVPGDVLITSGLGTHYLPGYPLGRVRSVSRDPGLQFATIWVEPIAHLDRGTQVLIIWPRSLDEKNANQRTVTALSRIEQRHFQKNGMEDSEQPPMVAKASIDLFRENGHDTSMGEAT